MILESIALIEKIDIPVGWQEKLIVAPTLSTRSVRCFVAPDSESCQIRFINNAIRQHPSVASRFTGLLASGKRLLAPADVSDLTPIVGEMADATQFRLRSAEIKNLHERSVLWIEGNWIDGNYWAGSLFFLMNETTDFVQEIGCLCDLSQEEKRKPLFGKMFDSIKWKQ